jgi:hypothetical protein
MHNRRNVRPASGKWCDGHPLFPADLLGITATEPRVDGAGIYTDFLNPAILLYEPQADGGLEPVGVENLVFKEAWHAAGNTEPPVFAGQSFNEMVPAQRWTRRTASRRIMIYTFGSTARTRMARSSHSTLPSAVSTRPRPAIDTDRTGARQGSGAGELLRPLPPFTLGS